MNHLVPSATKPSLLMVIQRTQSVAETEALGESLGRSQPPGTVIGLSGGMGAGKTAFVRGFARGLGCTGGALSPTFALFHEYPGGRCRLFHLDLYRLQGPEDVRAAGLEEYLIQPDGIALVEWVERWWGIEPAPPMKRFHFGIVGKNAREIGHDDPGI